MLPLILNIDSSNFGVKIFHSRFLLFHVQIYCSQVKLYIRISLHLFGSFRSTVIAVTEAVTFPQLCNTNLIPTLLRTAPTLTLSAVKFNAHANTTPM